VPETDGHMTLHCIGMVWRPRSPCWELVRSESRPTPTDLGGINLDPMPVQPCLCPGYRPQASS
jgi:hypothetical protein